VVLVGAGPGDPGLLTIKGKQYLRAADVVIYDRLVCDEILKYAPGAKKIYVGKAPGKHSASQREINDILLREAAAGGLIVRLKGGDPYLFGRGAEEAHALAQHEIPFEVVPGVTSALAVAAYAGIAVTNRGFSRSVHILTGHARENEEISFDFDALCRMDGTLVFLMAVANLSMIAKGLLNAGMASDTPAAVVENGTLPQQRMITGTLASIATQVETEEIRNPAVFIVGWVCSPSAIIDWRSMLPLIGRTAVVTRPEGREEPLGEKLRALGAQVMHAPCIEIESVDSRPVQDVLRRIDDFSWLVLTNSEGVKRLFAVVDDMGMDARALSSVKIAVVGAGTAQELKKYGVRADYLPEKYDAVHLAEGMSARINAGERALLLRAEKGTDVLSDRLEQAGIVVEDIALYKTVLARQLPKAVEKQLCENRVDYVIFSSASTVEGFAACMPEMKKSSFTAVCIGDASCAAARAQGYCAIGAANATVDCIVEALLLEEERKDERNRSPSPSAAE
jgi:uroporphyrin-III C-methyltransferase